MQNLGKTAGVARSVRILGLTTISAAFTSLSSLSSMVKMSVKHRTRAVYQPGGTRKKREREREGFNDMMQKSEIVAFMKSTSPKSPVELAIDELLINADVDVTAKHFDACLETWLQKSGTSGVSNFVRIIGKKSKTNDLLYMRRNLPLIASRLDRLSSLKWDISSISNVLYSLHGHEETDAGYSGIVAVMSKILEKAASMDANPRPRDISIILYGLRNSKYQTEASKRIMNSLELLIKAVEVKADSQAVGNSLYGLQNMSSNNPEVRSLISALTPYLLQCE